jgi:hypothetical protein
LQIFRVFRPTKENDDIIIGGVQHAESFLKGMKYKLMMGRVATGSHVVRAVLEHVPIDCEEDITLLDVLFGRSASGKNLLHAQKAASGVVGSGRRVSPREAHSETALFFPQHHLKCVI